MASGWTNSGIDWTSVATMRNSRTEDVVREIYLAVNERDYWISFFNPSWRLTTPQRTLPLLDRTGRMRVENQMQYIYNTVKTWVTPFADINPPTSGNFYTLNESCFLDETSPFNLNLVSDPSYKPFKLLERRWYGKKNLDYSQGGTLETLLNYDLALFRTYEYKRIDLGFLKMIYDLLNLDLKISNSYTRLTNSITEGQSRVYKFELNSNDFYGYVNRLSSSKSWSNSVLMQDGFDENIDLFNAIYEGMPPTSEGSFVKQDSISASISSIGCKANTNGSGRSGCSKDVSYGSYIMNGFNNTQFDMSITDIQIDNYIYLKDLGQTFFDYLPVSGANLSLGINSYNPTIQNIDSHDVFLYTNNDPRPWPYGIAPADSSGIQKKEDLEGYPVIFLNIDNQEGFLNYYTEPTP